MQQLENELAQTQINLETATKNLEEKEKALQNVRYIIAESWALTSTEQSAQWSQHLIFGHFGHTVHSTKDYNLVWKIFFFSALFSIDRLTFMND